VTVEIVGRSAWGARYAPGAGAAPLPAREVWLHHSVTVAPDLVPPFDDEDAAMRQLEVIGQQRFAQGVSYTFAVMPSGRVYEGHGVGTLGAHTKGRNSIARAIVLVGNYDEAVPTAEQCEAVASLLVHGQRSGWWTAAKLTGGHQQAPYAATGCPGLHGMECIDDINARAAAPTAPAKTPRNEGAPSVQLVEIGDAKGTYVGWFVIDWATGTYWTVGNQLQLDLIRASGKVHQPSGRQPAHALAGLRRIA
jgi:hypothetical protein